MHGAGVDEPLAWYEGAAVSSATRRYLHANHQGSIVAVTGASGSTLQVNAYDSYGVTAASNTGRFQYTGQAAIPELGLLYYKARFYNAGLGRFMQTDPIGYEDDVNLYAYVGNDPLNSIDPSGSAQFCAATTGTRIPSCVSVDGNGDGNVNDNDLTKSQVRTLSNNFATFIGKNNGRNISGSGATVVGEDDNQTRFIRAVSQFVGHAMGGWDGITIQMADTSLLKYASGDTNVTSETRGYWIEDRNMIGINTDSPSTFTHGGNAARVLIHERLHKLYPGAHLTRSGHKWLNEEARGQLKRYGLGDGGCEAIGGIFGLFPTFPACN